MFGLLKALEHIPPDSPGYAKVLEKAQEDCGVALDHAALLALYYSTDGPNWWYTWPVDASEDHCAWMGVLCRDDNGRAYFLALRYFGLNGQIPRELGNLSFLEHFDLGGNKLYGPIPIELGNLSNLEGIALYNNELSGSIPKELANLSNLKQLALFGNPLISCWETQAVKDWAYLTPDLVTTPFADTWPVCP